MRRFRLVGGLGLAAWLAGCAGALPLLVDPTKGPHITSWQVHATFVHAGATVNLGVAATSPDSSPITYRWQASAGVLNDPYAQYPVWVAPTNGFSTNGFVSLSVQVRDDKGRMDTRQAQVSIQ